jgi:hypothetical protein
VLVGIASMIESRAKAGATIAAAGKAPAATFATCWTVTKRRSINRVRKVKVQGMYHFVFVLLRFKKTSHTEIRRESKHYSILRYQSSYVQSGESSNPVHSSPSRSIGGIISEILSLLSLLFLRAATFLP